MNISAFIMKGYGLYFGCELGNPDKSCSSHKGLHQLSKEFLKEATNQCRLLYQLYGQNHVTDWYFCLINVASFSSKNNMPLHIPIC